MLIANSELERVLGERRKLKVAREMTCSMQKVGRRRLLCSMLLAYHSAAKMQNTVSRAKHQRHKLSIRYHWRTYVRMSSYLQARHEAAGRPTDLGFELLWEIDFESYPVMGFVYFLIDQLSSYFVTWLLAFLANCRFLNGSLSHSNKISTEWRSLAYYGSFISFPHII